MEIEAGGRICAKSIGHMGMKPLVIACLAVAVHGRLPIVITPNDAARGAILFGVGDAFAQSLEHHVDGRSVCREAARGTLVEPGRLTRAASVGTLYGGIILPFVYQLAEHLFPGKSVRNIVLKTCVSCSMLSTGGNYYSLLIRRLLHPSPVAECFEERLGRCISSVHAIFVDVLLDDLKVWPLYDLLCFAVVPPQLRPTATAVVSVCWHSYVSFIANRPSKHA